MNAGQAGFLDSGEQAAVQSCGIPGVFFPPTRKVTDRQDFLWGTQPTMYSSRVYAPRSGLERPPIWSQGVGLRPPFVSRLSPSSHTLERLEKSPEVASSGSPYAGGSSDPRNHLPRALLPAGAPGPLNGFISITPPLGNAGCHRAGKGVTFIRSS